MYNLRELHNYIENMPALPTSTRKIVELSNSQQATAADINKIIKLDPVLTGKVLKLVNSAFYGLENRVSSLVRAIIMLGLNTVKNLALSASLFSVLGSEKDFCVLDAEEFWEHSLAVAVTSRLIAKNYLHREKDAETFFIAGLLHDIGKIPLNHCYCDDYKNIIEESNGNIIELETKFIGISHPEVAESILNLWNLDQNIIDAVRYHHTPLSYKGKDDTLVYSVAVANYFADFAELGFAGEQNYRPIDNAVWDKLELTPQALLQLKEPILDEILQSREFLEISKGQSA